MPRLVTITLLCAVTIGAGSSAALAQTPRTGRVLITVVDQTGAVIPAAAASVVGLDETTKQAALAPVKTSDAGVATLVGVTPGRYSVTGEFPGFELGLLRDIRVKTGDNKHVLVLPLQKVTEEVTVGRDPQTAGSDRTGAFGSALTKDQTLRVDGVRQRELSIFDPAYPDPGTLGAIFPANGYLLGDEARKADPRRGRSPGQPVDGTQLLDGGPAGRRPIAGSTAAPAC